MIIIQFTLIILMLLLININGKKHKHGPKSTNDDNTDKDNTDKVTTDNDIIIIDNEVETTGNYYIYSLLKSSLIIIINNK